MFLKGKLLKSYKLVNSYSFLAIIRTIFIIPSYIPLPKIQTHRYLLMATYSPHVGFDDMDKMIERASEMNSPESQMGLNIFLLLSEKDDTANH
jgi:phosphatidylinositol glycan class Z